MFWLEIWQSKMEVSLGIDSMCCPEHIPLLLTTRVYTRGTVSELQAARFGDMSPPAYTLALCGLLGNS